MAAAVFAICVMNVRPGEPTGRYVRVFVSMPVCLYYHNRLQWIVEQCHCVYLAKPVEIMGGFFMVDIFQEFT